MLSAVPARSGHGDHLGELVAAVRPEFCGEVIPVSPEDPVFGRGRCGWCVRAQRLGAGSVRCSPPTVGQPRQARPRGVQGGAAAVAAARQRADQTRQRATEALQRLHAPRNRSRSHTSPAQQACLGPGSTASPICEPTSTGSAELPQPRLSPFHHLNEDQPNRCYNALRPPSTRSPDSRPTTTSSENTSPITSATGAKTASPPRQRHVSHMNPKLRTTTASSPPDNSQQPAPSPAPNRPRLHQPHQLRSPRHPRDIMTPTGASNLHPTIARTAQNCEHGHPRARVCTARRPAP